MDSKSKLFQLIKKMSEKREENAATENVAEADSVVATEAPEEPTTTNVVPEPVLQEVLPEAREIVTEVPSELEAMVSCPLRSYCSLLGYNLSFAAGIPDEDLDAFLRILRDIVKVYPENPSEFEGSIDATVYTYVSRDSMRGLTFMFPPINDGAHITMDQFEEAFAKGGIKHGVNTRSLLISVRAKSYCRILKVADGQPAINGEDGYTEHLININTSPTFAEDERGNIDFKSLNITNEHPKDTKICKFYYPTAGTDGMNVAGGVLKARAGKRPDMTKGINTHYTEERDYLLSSITGRVSFDGSAYNVNNVYAIAGDVDMTIGNVKFSGDVHVKGDVKDGFNIDAGGSVFVEGLVEDSQIKAGGDIVISKGMNGDGKGSLICNGRLQCKYLENCNLEVKGNVTTQSAINCNITSQGSVIVSGGKGVLAGGTIIAAESIEAKTIGSRANRETALIIRRGSKDQDERRKEMTLEIRSCTETMDKLQEGVNLLLGIGENNLPPQQKQLLTQLREQLSLYDGKKTELSDELQEMVKSMHDYSRCRIRGSTVHAPVKVQINNAHYTVRNEVHMSTFRLDSNGEIELMQSV